MRVTVHDLTGTGHTVEHVDRVMWVNQETYGDAEKLRHIEDDEDNVLILNTNAITMAVVRPD